MTILLTTCQTVQAPVSIPVNEDAKTCANRYNDCRNQLKSARDYLKEEYEFINVINQKQKWERFKAGAGGFVIGFGVGAIGVGITAAVLYAIKAKK